MQLNNPSSGTVFLNEIINNNCLEQFNYSGKTIVIKAGGSVLENNESYKALARIIETLITNNARVYCVLSARKGRTEELIKECDSTGELGALLKDYDNEAISKSKLNNKEIAAHLLKGEIDSVGKLSQELTIPHRRLIQGTGFPIIANSNYLNAVIEKEALKKEYLMQENENLILVAGFGAENKKGEKVILGRDASDLIAILLSQDENVNEVIYIKDVPGIYTKDKQVIKEITNQEIIKLGIKKVLDPRIYEWQRTGCDIRVTDLKNPGTIIKKIE